MNYLFGNIHPFNLSSYSYITIGVRVTSSNGRCKLSLLGRDRWYTARAG
jgi:hypothetical protein